jgi:hypothetical protein
VVPLSGPLPPASITLGPVVPVEQTTTTVPTAQAEHARKLARDKEDRELLELQHQLHLRKIGFYAALFVFAVVLVAALVAAFWGADSDTRTWGRAGLMTVVTSLLSFLGGKLSK